MTSSHYHLIGQKGKIAFLLKKSAKLRRDGRPTTKFEADFSILDQDQDQESGIQPQNRRHLNSGYYNTIEMRDADEEEKEEQKENEADGDSTPLRRIQTQRYS